MSKPKTVELPTRPAEAGHPCLSRRRFLAGAGSIVTVSLLPMPWHSEAFAATAKLVEYPRRVVASLSALKVGVPVSASYPGDATDPLSLIQVIKLGHPAGAWVGPDGDIVAFSSYCTHMGMVLQGSYKSEHAVMGPCPLHLTTFDLTRHGMVIAGHATESLPQIVLETDGDDIVATGVLGLLYGKHNNLS